MNELPTLIDPFTVDRTGDSNEAFEIMRREIWILKVFGYCYILQDFSPLIYWNPMKT